MKVLVCDVDSTLIHAYFDDISGKPGIWRSFPLNGQDIHICYRPYLLEFLHFADQHFDAVYIWSAGTYDYIEKIMWYISQDFKKKYNYAWFPKLILSREECTYHPQQFYYKPIKGLVERMKSLGVTDFTEEEIGILDDNNYTFLENTNNGILIKPFTVDTIGYMNDNSLKKFQKWTEDHWTADSLVTEVIKSQKAKQGQTA